MSDRIRLLLVVLLAVAVHAPSVFWGFFCDDHGILLVLEGHGERTAMRPWDLYDFGTAPRPGDENYADGAFPWWTDADWKVRFARPVTSLAWMADHALFGRFAPGYHLSGLAWFALLLVLAHALFRALGLGPRTALLATLILGLEDGGAFPVGWPANRNTVVEAVFLVAAVLAVARPARVRARHVTLALAAALAAALAKESGIVAFAVVAVVLVWRARGPERRLERRAALAGAACALAGAALYLAWFLASGHGARCAFYPTPWGEPLVTARWGTLLLGTAPIAMASPIAPDPLGLDPDLAAAFLPVAAALSLAVLAGAVLLVRRAPRLLPFVALTLLAIAPQAGAPTSQRLLFVPMIGFAPLLALCIERWREQGRRRSALALFGSAVVLSGLACLAMSVAFLGIARGARSIVVDADVGTPADVGPDGTREALVLNSPTEFGMLVPITTWAVETGDRTLRFWPLQMGRRALRWTRLDESTFELALADAGDPPFGHGAVERVFLAREHRAADELATMRWRTALFDVERSASAGATAHGLRAARFTLPRSLDDPAYRFLAWDGKRLARVAPPAIGATLELAAVAPLFPMMP
jgi:hypothetical protein